MGRVGSNFHEPNLPGHVSSRTTAFTTQLVQNSEAHVPFKSYSVGFAVLHFLCIQQSSITNENTNFELTGTELNCCDVFRCVVPFFSSVVFYCVANVFC